MSYRSFHFLLNIIRKKRNTVQESACKKTDCRKIMALIYKTQNCFLNKKCLISLVLKACSYLMKPTDESKDHDLSTFPLQIKKKFFLGFSCPVNNCYETIWQKGMCTGLNNTFFINSHSLHQRKYNMPVLSKHHCLSLKFIVQFSLFPYRSYT